MTAYSMPLPFGQPQRSHIGHNWPALDRMWDRWDKALESFGNRDNFKVNLYRQSLATEADGKRPKPEIKEVSTVDSLMEALESDGYMASSHLNRPSYLPITYILLDTRQMPEEPSNMLSSKAVLMLFEKYNLCPTLLRSISLITFQSVGHEVCSNALFNRDESVRSFHVWYRLPQAFITTIKRAFPAPQAGTSRRRDTYQENYRVHYHTDVISVIFDRSSNGGQTTVVMRPGLFREENAEAQLGVFQNSEPSQLQSDHFMVHLTHLACSYRLWLDHDAYAYDHLKDMEGSQWTTDGGQRLDDLTQSAETCHKYAEEAARCYSSLETLQNIAEGLARKHREFYELFQLRFESPIFYQVQSEFANLSVYFGSLKNRMKAHQDAIKVLIDIQFHVVSNRSSRHLSKLTEDLAGNAKSTREIAEQAQESNARMTTISVETRNLTASMAQNTGAMRALNEQSIEENKHLANIAEDTRRDSYSMKAIAVLTMFYLPGSYVAAIFGMQLLQAQTGGRGLMIISGWRWFVLSSVLLTMITFGLWRLWVWRGIQKQRMNLAAAGPKPPTTSQGYIPLQSISSQQP